LALLVTQIRADHAHHTLAADDLELRQIFLTEAETLIAFS